MNKHEHLLQKLSEECAEVQKVISKALLFGLEDGRPGGTTTNKEELYTELNDVNAVIEMLNENFILDYRFDRKAVEAKKEKVKKFMAYAEKRGTLTFDTWAERPSFLKKIMD